MKHVEAASPATSCLKVSSPIKDLKYENSPQHTSSNVQQSSKTTAESSVEHLNIAETAEVPRLDLAATEKEDALHHTIVCREWQTECTIAPRGVPQPALSCIPEKDAVLWQIKDLHAFRSAARVSHIPPLVSPEFGGGCTLRLHLYDRKGHISGNMEIPIVKAARDGVAHFKVSVVRPDMKVITQRKVEMVINVSLSGEKRRLERKSSTFRLSKCRPFRAPKVDHLVVEDSLRIRVEFQYFPFDDPIFRGTCAYGRISNGSQLRSLEFGSSPTAASDPIQLERSAAQHKAELLYDIRTYCKEDPSQYVEIRRDDTSFQSCRFLLCARSKKFRDIFGSTNLNVPPTARGSPSRFAPFARSAAPPMTNMSLSSVTVQDISAECLDEMLAFIHTDSCQWLDDHSTDIFKVLELFEAADIYGVGTLARRLVGHLQKRLNTDNFVYMFEVSERCHDDDFKRICTQFMDSIPGSQVANLMRVSSISSETHVPVTAVA